MWNTNVTSSDDHQKGHLTTTRRDAVFAATFAGPTDRRTEKVKSDVGDAIDWK
jgi:hypothetical protein